MSVCKYAYVQHQPLQPVKSIADVDVVVFTAASLASAAILKP